MSGPECPFCARKDFPAAALAEGRAAGRPTRIGLRVGGLIAVPSARITPADKSEAARWRREGRKPIKIVLVDEASRGGYRVTTLTGKNLIKPVREFRLDRIALDSDIAEKPPGPPPVPVFEAYPTGWVNDKPTKWRAYYACRVTHEKSPVELLAHWWPTHGVLVSVRGFHPEPNSNEALEVVTAAMKVFQVETRGAQEKITEEKLSETLSKLGEGATQAAAARALRVSETALEKWRRRRQIKTWREVVERFSAPT